MWIGVYLEEMHKIDVPISEDGYYWFDDPIFLMHIVFDKICINYRVKKTWLEEIPVTLIYGILNPTIRNEIVKTDSHFVGPVKRGTIKLTSRDPSKSKKQHIIKALSNDLLDLVDNIIQEMKR